MPPCVCVCLQGKDQATLGFSRLFPDIKEESAHAPIIHPRYASFPSMPLLSVICAGLELELEELYGLALDGSGQDYSHPKKKNQTDFSRNILED